MNTEINIARKICSNLGWNYKDVGEFIIIGFDVNNVTSPIFVKQKQISSNGNPIIEITYTGVYIAADLERHSDIIKLLLKRNYTQKFGNWSIKINPGYDDDYIFTYNIEKQNLDTEIFHTIIGNFINEIKCFLAIRNLANEFRLIQLIKSIDDITKDEIEIYEMTPIIYNIDKTGYNFTTLPSTNNYFFIYLTSENLEEDFMSNPEEIKTMNFDKYEFKIIKTPEGDRKSFFSNKLIERRKISS